jgi:subtilisin family serine protease
VKYAQGKGIIVVASAGNDGKYKFVYPGALPNVINVASTSNQDVQSTFTNYGTPPVFMAARRRHHDALSMGHVRGRLGDLL